MIDLHTHLLPGLDDGARSLEEAVAMAEIAAQDGIQQILLTPHWARGKYEPSPETIAQKTKELQAACAACGIRLKFTAAAEVLLYDELPVQVRDGQVPTWGGQNPYLLLELPLFDWPLCMEEVIFQLQMQGLKLILAHPERYTRVQEDPAVLYRLSVSGVLAQVTAASLLGWQGPIVRRTAQMLIKQRWVQVIASDAHSLRSPPQLTEAVQAATALIGEEAARQMVTTVPTRILQGSRVPTDPLEPKRKRFWPLLGLRW
ncbi:MAG TPA: hypothetical protein EYP85_08035 [Armatimonadetes bacterium]|nr:hypothetical protein [Armatimonadota bacterium]